MGWKPSEFYEETIADIQIALAAHYDRIDFELTHQIKVARRMTALIVNTCGYTKRHVSEQEIMELPHEAREREKEKARNRFSEAEIQERLARWAKEGPGIKDSEDATATLMRIMK